MSKNVLRTPDSAFAQLPDFDFKPHYLQVNDETYGPLRMHYLDEGPLDAPPVLLLHGEPTWCFLYRHMIPTLVAAGFRVIAPDHIGFGRSDKLPHREDYSYQKFVDWMSSFIQQLDLNGITVLLQDWGGPIGLRTLASMPERFAAVAVSNTLLPNCQATPLGVDGWPGEMIENWVSATQTAEDLPIAEIVNGVCTSALLADVKAGYDAPFPDASYKAAALHFPSLIPIHQAMPGTLENQQTWQLLEQWNKPFVTAFSDGDPSTKAWEQVFQRRIPGAAGQPHTEISAAGHFVQEEQGEQLAQFLVNFIGSQVLP